MANDRGGTTKVDHERSRQQLDEFLVDANHDLVRLRGMEVDLAAGDADAWARLQTIAHNFAARSQILKLGVLNACARELQQLVEDHEKGVPADTFFLQCVTGAIETLALEIDSLKRA
jgi:hypothetical protein